MTLILGAEAAEWWQPILLGAFALPILVGAGAMVLLLRDVRSYILPHFLPPKPGEVDVSMPARVSRIESDIAPTNGDRSSISDRVDSAKYLAMDVKTELADYRATEVVDRRLRQDELDQQLKAGGDRMGRIEVKLGHIEGKQDGVLSLAQSSSEVRPRPRALVHTPETMDAHTVPTWEAGVYRLDLSGGVTVDMAETTFCDSAGLGALARLAGIAHGRIRCVNVAANVRKAMQILGTLGLFGVRD